MEEEELLTVPDVAKMLQCTKNHVYKLSDSGKLTYYDFGARGMKIRRFTKKHVQEYIESCTREAVTNNG